MAKKTQSGCPELSQTALEDLSDKEVSTAWGWEFRVKAPLKASGVLKSLDYSPYAANCNAKLHVLLAGGLVGNEGILS